MKNAIFVTVEDLKNVNDSPCINNLKNDILHLERDNDIVIYCNGSNMKALKNRFGQIGDINNLRDFIKYIQ